MGLFSRRKAAVAGTTWYPDGIGVDSYGDCGGDIQRGESYSVRYIHPDLYGCLVTVVYYPVEYDESPGEFVVQRQIEWMVCENPEDPGGTEVWSDVDYDDVSDVFHDTAESAEQEAREFAERDDAADPDINWDGEPFGRDDS